MKILIACSIARDSGAYVRGKYLTRGLLNQGCDIDYLSTFNSMPYGIYYLLSIPHNFFRILFKRCDAAIALKPYPNTIFPLLLKKLFGTKIIVDIDDLDIGVKKGMLGAIIRLFQSPFIKYFDLVLVHNEHLYQLVTMQLHVPEEKVLRIEQGVDLHVFKTLNNRRQIRAELGYSSKEKLIVYTGHLNVAAHLKEIFELFLALFEEDKNIRLIVVGGGPDEKKFKALAREMGLVNNVDMRGYIDSQDKIVKYLNIADACVVYYPAEEFNKFRCSMKLREYLAVGIPTVCNDFGDLAKFKNYCYSFKTGDFEGFKKMMKMALYTPDGREFKGKKLMGSKMSWDKIANKIYGAIKKC